MFVYGSKWQKGMEDIGENQVKIARLQTMQTTNATVHFFTGCAVRSILF